MVEHVCIKFGDPKCGGFYLRDAMLGRYLPLSCVRVSVCPTVCMTVSLSVIRRYCTKMNKPRITQTTTYDSPGTLVFGSQQPLLGNASFPLKLALKETHPAFEHNDFDFDQYSLIVPQPRELAKNVQLTPIESRPCDFQRAIHKPSKLILSPRRVAQNQIWLFLQVKFNLCRKKFAATFLCMKTSSSRVVATSFLYLMIPIYVKFALKLTHPFKKRRYWQISLSVSAVRKRERESGKVQLSLTGSRQCAFHQAIDKPDALPLSPQRVAQNKNFYILRCLSYLRCR